MLGPTPPTMTSASGGQKSPPASMRGGNPPTVVRVVQTMWGAARITSAAMGPGSPALAARLRRMAPGATMRALMAMPRGPARPPGVEAQGVACDLLLAVCRRFMGLLCDPEVEAMYRVVMAEAVNHPRIAELFFETVPLATKAAVSAALSGLLSRGELRLHNPDHASWRLFNLCLGACTPGSCLA